jgi:hypothetical protein
MEWFYVFSRDQGNGQVDLQRFETLDKANGYKFKKSSQYWDSVVVKQSDIALFNFFDDEKSNNSFYEIGKL